MKKKRIWIFLGVAAVLAVVGWRRHRAANAPATSAQGDDGADLGRVTEATLLQTIDSSGSVSAGIGSDVVVWNVRHGEQGQRGTGCAREERRRAG